MAFSDSLHQQGALLEIQQVFCETLWAKGSSLFLLWEPSYMGANMQAQLCSTLKSFQLHCWHSAICWLVTIVGIRLGQH
jgi:hypothetical protein